MDYSRPERRERLAAEYVLGTLRGPARRRFERLLPAHPSLRSAVAGWQERLAPLSDGIAAVTPPARVWDAVERRLFGSSAALVSVPGIWARVGLWRFFAGAASAVALGLLVMVLQPPAAVAPVVVVLSPEASAGQAAQVAFVASVSGDGRVLVIKPLEAPVLAAEQALELWAVPAQGAPRSLGLVRTVGSTTVRGGALLSDTAAFAVSIEPARGSPTRLPTGPIVSVGRLQL